MASVLKDAEGPQYEECQVLVFQTAVSLHLSILA